MKLALSFTLAVSWIALAIAGCAGTPRRQEVHWDEPTTSATTASTTETVDAGTDAGDADAGPAPGLALFQRSCTPCHTRSGSHDPYAVTTNVYFETDADFRRWASSDTIGETQSSLAEILALRADGLDLIVGHERLPMPPRTSSYAPFTPEEARTALTWLRAQH